MSDPTRLSDEERAREALRDQTDEARRLDPSWTDQIRDDQYPAPLPDEPVPSGERLFSRKVLFGWAFAALIFVFIIRMVLPVVFETVKETVVSKMREPTSNTAVQPVIAPVPAVPAIPEIPAIPAIPEVPTAPVLAPSTGNGQITVQAPTTKTRR